MVQDALASKEALDALALCCMIKLTFADSMVKGATIRRLMKVFHISYGRLAKAINEGLKRGYFIKDGEHLRANKVRGTKIYCVPLDIPVNKENGNCPIDIAKMCDQLRGAVLYNHIAKQNDLRDTVRLAREPRHGELKLHMRAKARLRKKSVCVDNHSVDDGLRLSYAKVASILNVSKSKAKLAIKRLRDKGLIKRVLQFEEIGLHIEEFSKELQKSYSRYAGRGFIVLRDGMVCLQLANAYLLQGGSIVKFLR